MSIANDGNPRAPAIWASIWTLWGLAAITVILRFKARRIRRLAWEVDDWTVLIALFFTFATGVVNSLGARYGIGKHIQDVSQVDQQRWYKCLFVGNIVYVGTGPSIKVAALLMYKRVFAIPSFQTIAKFGCAVCFIWYLGEILGSIFNCWPVQGFWDKNLNAKCITTLHFDIQYAVINISLDLVILALPIKMVLGLQLSAAQKVGFILLFMMGGLTTIAAVIRFVVFISNLHNPDYTFVWYDGLIWSCVEPSIGVISVCLPVLRPVLLAILPSRLRSSFHSRTDHIFKGGRQSTHGVGTTTFSSFHSNKKRADASIANGTFYRLEGDDIPLRDVTGMGSKEGQSEAQAYGSEAVSAIDEEGGNVDAIMKRTDVELHYESAKR